jgi:hypothetical protein
MGLDTTHDAWHGPYSSFMEWRIWVAKQVGINLLEMEGYSPDRDYTNPNRRHGKIKWETIEDDLKILLNHSDCDGHLTTSQCKKIADRLKTITDAMTDDYNSKLEDNWSTEARMYNATIRFRKGCMKAYKEKEKLKFH